MAKVLFVGGTYVKPIEEPRWSDAHKRWYCGGYRWIKSKKKWSSVALLHNFIHYEWLDESELGD